MSDWIECPKCPELARERAKALRLSANEGYGLISLEEYEDLNRQANEAEGYQSRETVRVFCEVGIRGGNFHVSYGATCEVCDFNFEFDHTEKNIAKVSG